MGTISLWELPVNRLQKLQQKWVFGRAFPMLFASCCLRDNDSVATPKMWWKPLQNRSKRAERNLEILFLHLIRKGEPCIVQPTVGNWNQFNQNQTRPQSLEGFIFTDKLLFFILGMSWLSAELSVFYLEQCFKQINAPLLNVRGTWQHQRRVLHRADDATLR